MNTEKKKSDAASQQSIDEMTRVLAELQVQPSRSGSFDRARVLAHLQRGGHTLN